jgi:CheY-like chemotaxis protein
MPSAVLDADPVRAARLPVILLIDDEPEEARMLDEAFRGECFPALLRHQRSGWDALRFVERRGGFVAAPSVDLVLVDLEMPAMHGHEVIMHLRRGPARLTVPVLAYSNSARVSDMRDSVRVGADGYLSKPFGYDGYRNVIAELRKWLPRVAALG